MSDAPLNAQAKTKPYWQGLLTVTEVIRETEDISTFRLAATNGPLPFTFLPGQYVDLALTIGDEQVHRSYSVSSSSAERRYIDLTIKREPQGLFSRYICDTIQVDDKIETRGPFGQFVFTGASATSVIFIGTGVGVTPLASMIRSLCDSDWRGDIYALFGFRRERDSLFLDELYERAAKTKKLNLFVSWSQPESRSTKPKGRLSVKAVKKFARGYKSAPIYICGPDEMMSQMRDGLKRAGAPERNINLEAFSPPPRDASRGGSFQITFEREGVSVLSEPGESILETGERAGAGFDYSCRNGTCGLCVAQLLSGEVDLLADDALEEHEIESGHILTCQSYPRKACIVR